MDSVEWDWPGARWWRCDLHTHSFASSDFSKLAGNDAAGWVAAAVAAKLDVVALTDHNSGRAVGPIREAIKASGARLTVLPGAEINCHPGVHLLVLFDPTSSDDVVTGFLGALGVPDEAIGQAEYLCPKSLIDVVEIAKERRGICIAAHVDGPKGLLSVQPLDKDGKVTFAPSLVEALAAPNLLGLEVSDPKAALLALVDGSEAKWAKKARRLPFVACSDAHQVADLGRSYTWVKMSKPTLEGLRLALLDQDLSVLPKWSADAENPNTHARYVLRGIRVKAAKHIGRSSDAKDLGRLIEFSPWFTAIIGGRGTGKSTIIDLLRAALEREDELSGDLRTLFNERTSPPAGSARLSKSLVTADTEVSVGAMRAATLYRAVLAPPGRARPRLELQHERAWQEAEGRVRDRLPARIYSQKQIYDLASEPTTLLAMLDGAPQVDLTAWERRFNEIRVQLVAHRQAIRQIQRELAEEENQRGRLDDLNRQIAVFEAAGHSDLLKAWHRHHEQAAAVAEWQRGVEELLEGVNEAMRGVKFWPLDSPSFATEQEREARILLVVEQATKKLNLAVEEIRGLIGKAEQILPSASGTIDVSDWHAHGVQVDEKYTALVQKLKDHAGGVSPDAFAELVKQRQTAIEGLKKLKERRAEMVKRETEATTLAAQLADHRRELSSKRQGFINAILGSNADVRIRVVEYGAAREAISTLRGLLKRDSEFGRDIDERDRPDTLRARLYAKYELPTVVEAADRRAARVAQFEARLASEKQRLRGYADGTVVPAHQHFSTFLKSQPAEFWDAVETWFPPDDLLVEFKGRDGKWQSVASGSPGQRTAALLSFLLHLGDEPLVLDQPEDDLDNQLVYELVVSQIRAIKLKRQVIVVTHNANIVVNGDAECVIALAARGGQTHVDACGGLQEDKVRELICAVMEGGPEAFERRWQRIGKR